MITADLVNLSYLDGLKKRKILSDVCLSIDESETAVIFGPSGAGKSSLLYLLSGLRKPNSGKVIFDDIDITAIEDTDKIRYENFGFVFQQHFLIPYLTVFENVCLAKKDKNIKLDAQDILKELGLESFLHKLPYELSGGERQRVAIARALVKKPKIIFADEPTASLDKETAIQVFDLLKNFSKSCTLIAATHDTSLLSGNERIFSICNGSVTEHQV
jgi:ABC-type antimicrobial peptide transport system, ATPase component